MTSSSGTQDGRTLVVRPRLGELLREIGELVDAGDYDADPREGVLLDVTVDQVRCVLLHQEPAPRVTLSPREWEIALMVAHGRTNQAIATSLDISVWTVSTHLRRIFAKLCVSSRAEMVARLLADHDHSPLVPPET